jgi:hypothetical protein
MADAEKIKIVNTLTAKNLIYRVFNLSRKDNPSPT